MKLNILRTQATRFIGVVIISAVINYSLFYALLFLGSVNYLVSSSAGYLAGLLLGFFLNSNWTFGRYNLNKDILARYLFLYISSLSLGLILLRILVHNFYVLPEIANIAILVFTTLSNFIGLKFWVFKRHK